jgi:WD40 repeat protein
MPKRLFSRPTLLLLGVAMLTACSAKSPDTSLEVAVDGLYGGALSKDASHAVIGAFTHGGSYWQLSPGERLFDWNHGGELNEVPILGDALRRGRTFSAARFSDNNQQLITGSSDRMVQLWQLPEMQELARWELPKRSAWKPTGAAVIDVGFDAQGRVVAIASNGSVHHMQP